MSAKLDEKPHPYPTIPNSTQYNQGGSTYPPQYPTQQTTNTVYIPGVQPNRRMGSSPQAMEW